MKVIKINNLIIPLSEIRTYFLLRKVFLNFVFLKYHKDCINEEEDLTFEKECYYSNNYDFLYTN